MTIFLSGLAVILFTLIINFLIQKRIEKTRQQKLEMLKEFSELLNKTSQSLTALTQELENSTEILSTELEKLKEVLKHER